MTYDSVKHYHVVNVTILICVTKHIAVTGSVCTNI